jgi:hypothetical protein
MELALWRLHKVAPAPCTNVSVQHSIHRSTVGWLKTGHRRKYRASTGITQGELPGASIIHPSETLQPSETAPASRNTQLTNTKGKGIGPGEKRRQKERLWYIHVSCLVWRPEGIHNIVVGDEMGHFKHPVMKTPST